MNCERCNLRDARNQVCAGDGKYHHHGHVHTVDGQLLKLCDECLKADAEAWAAKEWHWSHKINA